MKKAPRVYLALALLFVAACATARLEKSLDPDSRNFLSKVRYLITKGERRTFINLPAEERRAFTAEFWKKRDPDPQTEENEFKDGYFQRIEEANHLFNEGRGSEPGWLQDRGRIYILLGSPDNREQYPRGMSFYDIPTEIWYYGFFPIVFRDPAWTGNYRLEPDSTIQLVEIMKTQLFLKPQIAAEKGLLECRTEIVSPEKGKAVLRVKVPYRRIWFKEENSTLQATLTLTLTALDAQEKPVWEFSADYPLIFTAENLVKAGRNDYIIEAPLSLPAGKYLINLTLVNSGDGAKIFKRVPLNL